MKPHFFELGLPLRGFVSTDLIREQEQQNGVPLRGGFSNFLFGHPSKDRGHSSAVSESIDPLAELFSSDESFPQQLHRSKAERCPPPIICIVPAGRHFCVRLHGSDIPRHFDVTESWSNRFNRDFQALLASGQRPFFDFNHRAGVAGYPTGFFWDASRGVMATVDWSDEGAEAILRTRRHHSFSPRWFHAGGDALGIGLNCGGLLDADTPPAFGAKMPVIVRVPKLRAVEMLAKLFVNKADRLMANQQIPVADAFSQIREEFPRLYAAFAFQRRISEELDLRA